MTGKTEAGHVLVIPVPSDASKQGRRLTIHWNEKEQGHCSGDYYAFIAENQNAGELL